MLVGTAMHSYVAHAETLQESASIRTTTLLAYLDQVPNLCMRPFEYQLVVRVLHDEIMHQSGSHPDAAQLRTVKMQWS